MIGPRARAHRGLLRRSAATNVLGGIRNNKGKISLGDNRPQVVFKTGILFGKRLLSLVPNKLLMKTGSLLPVVVMLIAFSCKSSKNVDAVQPVALTGLAFGDVEIDVPCSGPEFFTDALVFRANSVGVSNDLAVSKRVAMSNARADLAAAINVTVGTVTDSYVKSSGAGNREALSQRFESLTREVVAQRLSGLRTLCERYFLTEAGRYKTYVAIELSAQQLAESYHRRVLADSALSIDFDYEKFKAVFGAEMAKRGQN